MATSTTSPTVTSLAGWAKARWLAVAAGAGAAVGLLATRVSTPPLMLVAAVGLLGAATIVAVPELGLLAIVFSTYVRLSQVLAGHFSSTLTLMKLLVPGVALAVLIQWLWRGRRPEGWLQPALLAAAYCVAGILSLPAAVDLDRALGGLAALAKNGIVLVLVVILIQRGATLRRVVWTLLAAGLLMGTFSVHQYMTGNSGFDYWGLALEPGHFASPTGAVHRVVGPIGDPNRYGLILLVLIPFAIDRIAGSRRPVPRILALATLGVCSMSIVFTHSRGAFVALVGMLASLVVIRRPRPRYVVAALVVAAMLSPLLPSSYIQRIQTLAVAITRPQETIGFEDFSMRGRLSENLAAVQMFLDHPLVGVGLNNYPVRYQDYSQEILLDPRSTERATHNLYLETAAETGIVGLLALGVLLWVVFRGILVARRTLREPELAEIRGMVDAVAIGLLGFLAGSLFLHAAHARYFWLLAGIALALPRVAASELAALRQASRLDTRSH